MMNFLINTVFSTTSCDAEIQLFGVIHLSLMIITFVVGYFMVKYKLRNEFIEKVSTVIILILHLLLYVWYFYSNESFIHKALPLYTCRLVLYLFTIGIFFKNQFCLKLGTYWGFYGGIAGLLLPSIFKYPFPHILQISTFLLHVYIFLLSGNYLFVKRIGMNKEDTKMCCKWTIYLLIFNTIFNVIFGTNYTSTMKMPVHLLNVGFNIPTIFCFAVVAIGYIIATIIQHLVVTKYEENIYNKKSVKEGSIQ